MNKVYTFEELKNSTYSEKPHYLVVGHPISHSLSPLMHQTALNHFGIDADYFALDLNPKQIGSFAAWCNKKSFLGCNITIPFKESLQPIVDQLGKDAEEVGVINTISKSNHTLMGHNTDVFGFRKPLEKYMDFIVGQRVIIFGTGGASKAVRAALIQCGAEELVFVSRSPIKNQVKSAGVYTETVDYSQWQDYADEASAFINTTPVGMLPDNPNILVQTEDAFYLKNKLCYDLIYNPQETPFLKLAKQQNAKTLNGLDMLIYQGSKSFEIWTGNTFPVDKIRSVLDQYFE